MYVVKDINLHINIGSRFYLKFHMFFIQSLSHNKYYYRLEIRIGEGGISEFLTCIRDIRSNYYFPLFCMNVLQTDLL